jgi:hypothetical protein
MMGFLYLVIEEHIAHIEEKFHRSPIADVSAMTVTEAIVNGITHAIERDTELFRQRVTVGIRN